MLRFDDTARTLDLGVHDLLASGPRRGHLRLSPTVAGRMRMRIGQEVHLKWQAEQTEADPEYRSEVTVRHEIAVRDWTVTISGRIDGLSREGDMEVVEEIKSTIWSAERLENCTTADVPGWARQLQLYLWFLHEQGRTAVGRLVLVSVQTGAWRVLHVPHDPAVGGLVVARLDWILGEHEARAAWLERRRESAIPAPHPIWRPGQLELADEITAGLTQRRHLLIDAPTGYGKTAAALHGALRAAYAADKRVFFATARNTQQEVAMICLQAMAAQGMPVRAVRLRARDKVCLNEVVACRPDCCPYAERYFDKLHDHDLVAKLWATEQPAGGAGVPTVDQVIAVGEEAVACPYALSRDLVAGADVVVGDYNYLFDPSVGLSDVGERPTEWIFVIDEAHNLPRRARGYGSPEISRAVVAAAAETLGQIGGGFAACAELAAEIGEWLEAGCAKIPAGMRDAEIAREITEGLDIEYVRDLAERVERASLEYSALRVTEAAFADGAPDAWLELARALVRLRGAIERAGAESLVLWRRGWAAARPPKRRRRETDLPDSEEAGGIQLLCRDPARLLGPIFHNAWGSVTMSATLRPADFFQAMYGMPDDRVLRVTRPSPFPAENRRVLVVPEVSTLYRHRRRDRVDTARLISEAAGAVPGNVAVFFPSFAVLTDVAPLLELGERPVLLQRRGMGERQRERLLRKLRRGEGHVLLAVLGGIFSEGIDLPGAGLLAVVVVGPSLPAANLSRRLLESWFEERYRQGFRYAWLVPGMGRVVQAAGRVIRTPEDRGLVVLIGRRFLQARYRGFFPEGWKAIRTAAPADMIRGFWERDPGDAEEPGSAEDPGSAGDPEGSENSGTAVT